MVLLSDLIIERNRSGLKLSGSGKYRSPRVIALRKTFEMFTEVAVKASTYQMLGMTMDPAVIDFPL